MSHPTPLTGSGPTPSQIPALRELTELASLFFSPDWHNLGLIPRLNPLLVGPSGSGKTWLTRHMAYSLGEYPMLQLDYGNWLPTGAKVNKGHTLTLIHDFVLKHRFGVIHIDELDKFGSRNSDWNTCVGQELFSLLDHRIQTSHDRIWEPELLEKMRKGFFIIGSGTWQELWDVRPKAGFQINENHSTEQMTDRILSQTSIPTELFRRFNSRPILLGYLNHSDVSNIIRHLAQSMDSTLLEGIDQQIDEAVRSRKGIRWFEEFLTQRLIEIRRSQQKNDEYYF